MEESKETSDEPKIIRRITYDEYIKEIEDEIDNLNKLAQKAEEDENLVLKYFYLKINRLEKKYQKYKKERDDIEKQKASKRVISFDDTDLDSGLNNVISIRFLEENDLVLPSRIQNESYETIKRYQRKAERLANDYKNFWLIKLNSK